MGGPLVNKTFSLPRLFWWQGPDGSRLLTLYSNDYGTEPLPPKDWPSSAWVYIHMTADSEGPPAPSVVDSDLTFYKRHAPAARVRIGRLEDFADLVLADKPELPVVRSDLPDPCVHGLLSHPAGTKMAHDLRPLISALDAIMTLEKAWGIYRPSAKLLLAEAYSNSLLSSEHT
jgi:alpha-mannosidase